MSHTTCGANACASHPSALHEKTMRNVARLRELDDEITGLLDGSDMVRCYRLQEERIRVASELYDLGGELLNQLGVMNFGGCA